MVGVTDPPLMHVITVGVKTKLFLHAHFEEYRNIIAMQKHLQMYRASHQSAIVDMLQNGPRKRVKENTKSVPADKTQIVADILQVGATFLNPQVHA